MLYDAYISQPVKDLFDQLTYKKLRPYVHLLIWLVFAYKMVPVIITGGPVWGWYFLLYAVTLVVSTYFNFYVLVPAYFLTYRYRRYFGFFLLSWLFIVAFLILLVWIFNHYPKPFPQRGSMYAIAIVNFTIEYFLLSLAKLCKELYIKSQRGRQYQMEKLQAELQMLRTQLNPHFLFNTLNNIYALVTTGSDKAGDSILRLSDMLQYLLYETNSERVPLRDEITFIQTYIDLERLRLDDSQPVHLNIKGPQEGKIAPMILFNFVENAFKHAAGNAKNEQGHPLFIDIDISIEEDNMLMMSVTNSYKKEAPATSAASGIGVENAKKRLYLIYENDYLLDIRKTAGIYQVLLKIPCHEV